MNYNTSKITKTLKAGGVAALPTDTLFALSADATNEAAVQKIFNLKVRDAAKALPVFYPSIEAVIAEFHIEPELLKLCTKFWPGQLSVVLPKNDRCTLAKNINNNDDTALVRIPNNRLIHDVLHEFKKPIIGTSANVSGEPPLMSSSDIKSRFGSEIDYIYDCNIESAEAKPSTIIKYDRGAVKILRHGAITAETILNFID